MKYSIVYFSPHLDDVVLSCGGFLRKSRKTCQLVVNIFTREYKGLTNWDLICGIKKDPILVRKGEDHTALKWIKPKKIYLNFLDNAVFRDLQNKKRPYGDTRKIKNQIFKILNKNISPNGKVFFPIGVSHPDHFLVAKIGREIYWRLKKRGLGVYFYEDFPFLDNLPSKFSEKFMPVYFEIDKEIFVKIKMVMAYKSQLFSLLQILGLKIKYPEENKKAEKMWKSFLLDYHRKLAKESKMRNVKFCERFFIFKK